MRRPLLFHVLLALLLTCTPTFAQSLADVLSSLQERNQVLYQRWQVDWHLANSYRADPPGGEMPAFNPIEWQGLEGIPFPTDQDTAGLGIDARITLLNQVIDQLRIIQRGFLNIRKEDLAAAARIGALRPYMLEDFADPGRVAPSNYHAVLKQVAGAIRRLSVVQWPIAGRKRLLKSNITQDPFTSYPTAIGPGTLQQDESWELSFYNPLIEDCNLGGDYTPPIPNPNSTPDPIPATLGVFKEEKFYDQVALFAAVPNQQGQLNGKAAVVVRNHWSPVPHTTVNVVAPTSWDPRDGACQVALFQNNAAGVYSMGAAPQVTVQLSWVDANHAFPTGYNVLSPTGLFTTNTWEHQLSVWNGFAIYGYYVMGRRLEALFTPNYTKGLDATGKAAWLDKSERATSSPAGDAKPILHAAPGLLAAIPLGTGLDGGNAGFIGITPGEDHDHFYWNGPTLISHSSQTLGTVYPAGDEYLEFWDLPNRFDYAASLRFIGSAQDFHVVYESSRELEKRGASLPNLVPTSQQVKDMGCKFFFQNWDLPRLKQVVSRDFIVNVTPMGHYKNKVEIYRRPADAGPVDRTPGELADVGEADPIRTLIIENPDATTEPYPDTPEKLHITDGTTIYKVWRDGYPDWGVHTTRYSGVVPPDLNFEVTEGQTSRYSKFMDFHGIGDVTVTTTLDTTTVSTEDITDENWYWFLGKLPTLHTITKGEQITSITNAFDAGLPNGAQYDWFPESSLITTTDEPDLNLTWTTSGRLASALQGSWRTDYAIESDSLKTESKFNNTTYATTWTDWSNHDRTIKTYTAPDGSISSKTANEVNWSQVTLGNTSGTGLPGLPLTLTRKDDSGAKWAWTVGADHSGSLILESGQLSNGNLQTGQKQTTAWNNRSYRISSLTELVDGGTTTVASFAVPANEYTDWGAPKQWQDVNTELISHVAYDSGRNRPASTTSPLGLITAFTSYDVFDRPGQVASNGITATNTYGALTTTTTYGGADVVSGSQSSYTHNLEGTDLATGLTWGGVVQSQEAIRGASSTAITGSHSLLGASSVTVRKDDGTTATADDATLAFGGVAGDALSVVGGLLITKTAVAGQTNTFAETHTDAWGRTRKVVTPSKSGSGNTETTVDYSLPDNLLKRVITTEPTGRILITESDAAGTISRSGIDVNGNGSLGSTDRYTESITTVETNKVVTTLSVTEDSGLREVLETKWTPSSGVTETKINGGEETITTTPDYAAKTVTTGSNKGWSKTDSINNLGLATNSSLTGTGIPHTELKPVWRADGSLASVDFDTITGPNNQKETHSASFNTNGTLSSLTAPGRGNILGGHSISNGEESLTVNGVTNTAKLDGTGKSISGANVMGKTDTLVLSGSGYQKNTHPVIGADTHSNFNAALATTGKTYADNSGETYGYAGELLSSIYLARGGSLALGYSNNGAKDLASAVWPAMASGPLTIPSIGHSFEYTRSGQIKTLGDPSGSRSLDYQKGRLSATTYTAGLLKGYQIIPGRDTSGRQTGTLIKRYGATIHSTQKALNGVSDQITNLASGTITATPQRDGAGRITGYIWSDGTNSVTQTWTRGTGGRIESAGSNVTGAASFGYLLDPESPEDSFDGNGRRLKCQTAGGYWSYIYGTGGQLTSAIHPTLGTFTYAFDGIGRRTDKGSANITDVLNRTTAWTNSQNKTLTIHADPNARVWYNGTEVQNFTGTHSATITPPGAAGGWVPWNTLAVLEGAGEGAGNPAANPLASPDAKAEKKGAVWVPPIAETLTYDAAGNRQSSAQWDFGWDAKNQLARARTKDYNTTAQGYDITFTYDAEGRRVKKHIIEYQAGVRVAEKIITFVWDGWDLLYERHQLPSGLTTLERKYLWGPDIADGAAGGAGGLLLIRETKGNTTTEIIPLYDGTGHVAALTNINKDLLASYAYGPFGEKISVTGPKANSNPWRFQTKYLDEETGLYYFGKRYYDPITGQWLSREILGESESPNLYTLTGNDPINHVDVKGLEAVAVDATLDNGIPAMVYEEWAGSGLAYMWNAFAAGKVKNWKQSPNSEQLAVNFYQEDGKWHLRSEDARHNKAWELIPSAVANKMEEIKPVMDTLEIGGAAIASAPLAVVAGTAIAAEGAGVYVYGGYMVQTAMANSLVSGAVTLGMGTVAVGTGYGLLTDQEFRSDYVAMEMSSPAPGEGTVMFAKGLGMAGRDLQSGLAACWKRMSPAMGEGFEQLLYRSGGLAYAVSPTSTLSLAKTQARKPVLLGEYMVRVRAAAQANPQFRVWPAKNWDQWVDEGVETQKNIRWLRDQIHSDVQIFSLGKTPGFGRGDYYRAETTELLNQGFRRRSAGSINVPGFGDVPLYQWIRP